MKFETIAGSGGGGCFRAGTQVQLEGGKTIAIEELKEGDEILAFDEDGRIHLAKVAKVHYHADPQPILRVRFWRGEVSITPNHWVLNQYGNFVEMGSLTDHDAVVDGMGHLRPIIGAELIGHEPVWNLTVEPHHTFIANGIRVHNGGHRESFPVVAGSGGGGDSKGGGGGRTPVEDSDTLRSVAMVSLLDLLGEGQIGGLKDNAKSIYLNGTPLLNSDGTANFTGVIWEFRDGKQTQDPISFISDVETPHADSVQVKTTTPHTISITNSSVDAVRVIVSVGSLVSQDMSTGDMHGSAVEYQFMLALNGGEFKAFGDTQKIVGKTRSKYQRAHRLDIPKPFSTASIKVIRVTPDSTSSTVSNDFFVDSYVEIINSRLSYPNSALVGIKIDSSQFSSIPSRSYLVDGLIIRVPSNYDSVTNTYNGIWNGTFKMEVSSNPAWILYDILTNTRYGLGEFIKSHQVDKARLYSIGKYCDEMVPDGFGGVEKRFSINTQIIEQKDAYKIVSDITSAFRGMIYWNGGIVGMTQDSPADSSMIYSPSNVIDGMFNYTGSARKDRHTVALITYNDPSDNFKQKIEYVENPALIQKYGIRKAEAIAFGCTSRGQAARVGRWILYTEEFESDFINFKVGMDSALVLPGEVIQINDPKRAGKRMGGRLQAVTATSAVLDADFTLAAGPITLTMRAPDGTLVDRVIAESNGVFNTVTWTSPLTDLPLLNSMFVMAEPTLELLTARVVGIAQDDSHTFSITALSHNPSKYAAIENGMALQMPQTSTISPYISEEPYNVQIFQTQCRLSDNTPGVELFASWSGQGVKYQVRWRKVGENWHSDVVKLPTYEVKGVVSGDTYEFEITSISAYGVYSVPVTQLFTVTVDTTPPGPCSELTAIGDFRTVHLSWSNPTDLDLSHVNIYENTVDNFATAVRVGQAVGSSFIRGGLPGLSTRFYWVRAVDYSGNEGPYNSNLGVQATTVQATHNDLVQQFIDSSLLVPELLNKIESNEYNATALMDFYSKANDASTTAAGMDTRITALEAFKEQSIGATSSFVKATDLVAIKNEAAAAAVATINAAYLGATGSIAQQVTDLETRVGNNFASLNIDAQTINGLKGQYTVRIDNNGYISGFGLASGEGGTSEFTVLADKFAVVSPNSADGVVVPFVIDYVNGVPRVSINDAFITKVTSARLSSPDGKFVIDLSNKNISIEV